MRGTKYFEQLKKRSIASKVSPFARFWDWCSLRSYPMSSVSEIKKCPTSFPHSSDFNLFSWFKAQHRDQNSAELVKVSILTSNQLQYSLNGDHVFSIWRAASTAQLYRERSSLSCIYVDIVVSKEIFSLAMSLSKLWFLYEWMELVVSTVTNRKQIFYIF